MITIKLHQKSSFKNKKKRKKHRTFDTEVNNSDNVDFFFQIQKEKKNQ